MKGTAPYPAPLGGGCCGPDCGGIVATGAAGSVFGRQLCLFSMEAHPVGLASLSLEESIRGVGLGRWGGDARWLPARGGRAGARMQLSLSTAYANPCASTKVPAKPPLVHASTTENHSSPKLVVRWFLLLGIEDMSTG